MKKFGGIAALVTVLVVLCAVIALEWYAHVGGNRAAPQPVQQIAAASPAASPTAGPVTYVPKTSPSPTSAPVRSSLTPAPGPVASAAAAPVAGPATAPPGVATAAPTATPYSPHKGVIANEPLVAATLAPHIARVDRIMEPPNAPPRILSMSISSPVAHGGDVVSGTVETSSNVASVEARIAGYSSTMEKVGVGKFVMSYRVPKLPFFLHRTYNIEVIARNTNGDAVRSSIPITIR